MSNIPSEFAGVTAVVKANVYFDGKVVSHTLLFPDGGRKTLILLEYGGVGSAVEGRQRSLTPRIRGADRFRFVPAQLLLGTF
jgi:hypothetical protein